MAFKTQFIYEAIDKLTPSLKKIGETAIKMEKKIKDSAKKSGSSFKKMGVQVEKVGKTMKSIGSGMTKWLTVPITGAFTASILAGGKYQDALASLSAITGVQGDQLKKLSSDIMSTSNAFGIASTEIASGMERIGSNQPELLTNPDLLLKVGKSAIIMSKASGMAFDEAGDSLTGIMNQFSLTGKESDRVMNVLSAGAKFGSATIKQLSDAMVGIGPSAKDAGLSLEQTVATMEVLASKGLKGANAGTKLRNIFTKMSVTMGKKFNPQVVGMAKALENVGKLSDKKLIKSFNEENINTIKILTQNVGMFKSLERNVMGSNAGFEQAKVRMNTFNERIKRLWQTLKNGLIKVFLILEPLLSKIVDKFIVGATAVGNFMDRNKKLTVVMIALAGAVAIIGPALLIMGGAFAKISASLPIILPILAGIAGISFAPLIVPALILSGVIGGIVLGLTQVWKTSIGFRSFFKTMWSEFNEAIEPTKKSFRDLFTAFKDIGRIGARIFSAISEQIFGAKEGIEEFSLAGATTGHALAMAFNTAMTPIIAMIELMEGGIAMMDEFTGADPVDRAVKVRQAKGDSHASRTEDLVNNFMAKGLSRQDALKKAKNSVMFQAHKRKQSMDVNLKVAGDIKSDGKPIQNQSITADSKVDGKGGAGVQ